MAERALDDIRVLDLSRVLAGPWATQLLADLGADVIKVERIDGGDDTRAWGPPWFGTGQSEQSAYFSSANRGKQSIAVDFTKPAGAKLVADLAQQSDVVVENFKVGGLAAYGLDYASLKAANPRLIYCAITGFGQDGPDASRPGYDFIIQAMGGLMSLTGEPGQPMKVGVALVDILSGLYACNGILAALHQRERTGEGQYIDISLLDVQVAALANQAANYLATGRNPQKLGNAHPNIVPYQTFTTLDGAVAVAIGNDAQFVRLCKVLGMTGLARDARFTTNQARVENREQLIPILQGAFNTRLSGDWLSSLDAANLPAGPVNDVSQVFSNKQVLHRRLRRDIARPTGQTVPTVACPVNLSASAVRYDMPPPQLGEQGAAVLGKRLGLDSQAIAALVKAGVVWCP
jgi:crotonobetainyl-CoA:carnitine CoA-transferase CaiB-like acyl-CoA transferase